MNPKLIEGEKKTLFYVTNVRALNSLSCNESPINREALVKGHFIEFIPRLGFIKG